MTTHSLSQPLAWNIACPERLLAYPSGEPIPAEQRTPRVFTRKFHTCNRIVSLATANSSKSNIATGARNSIPFRPDFSNVMPHQIIKCSNCGNPSNSTQDVDFGGTLLHMGLSLVGRQADQRQIRDITNILVNETPSTSASPLKHTEGNQASVSVETNTGSFPMIPENPLSNHQQSIYLNTQDHANSTPLHTTTTSESESPTGLSQKMFPKVFSN